MIPEQIFESGRLGSQSRQIPDYRNPKIPDGRPTNSAQKTKPSNEEFKRPMPKPRPGVSSKPVSDKQTSNASVQNSQKATDAKAPASNSKGIAQKTNVRDENSKSIPQTKSVSEKEKHTSPSNDTRKAADNKTSQADNNTTQKTSPSANVAGQNKKPNTTQNNKQETQANGSKQKSEPQKSEGNTKSSPTNTVPKSTAPAQDKKSKADNKVSQGGEVSKKEQSQSTPDKRVEEKRELDPFTEQILENELQNIMIQVWQEIPHLPEDNEKPIVDKLSTEVCDDLRRVLGLNATKRLLNVFNTLFVRVHFTRRPHMGCLTAFLKKYNIGQFSRIDNNSNIFAAQMNTIEDFDKLCSSKELTCGEAKVKVLPCYRFTHCPENLKTIYDDTFYYENKSQEQAELFMFDNEEKAGSEKNKPDADKKDTNKLSTDSKKDPINEDVDINENDLENLDMDIQAEDLDDFDVELQENDLEGEEELDDEDILALMSEGVIVDECSGSEDEK